MYHVYTVQVYS